MKTHTINGVEWTEEQMRVAIAKACGWKFQSSQPSSNESAIPPSGPLVAFKDSPNYLHDLNAMHEVEKAILPALIEDYVENVGELVREEWVWRGKNVGEFSQRAVIFCHLHATALQRAVAFIDALDLTPE